MKNFKILYIVSIIFLLNSCADSENKEVVIDGLTHSFSTIKGKKEGGYYITNEKGDTLVKANYKNDLLDGKKIFFDSVGNKKKEVFYINGKRNGVSKDYFKSGEVANLASFKNDLADGEWFQLNQYGDTLKYYLYVKDTLKYYKALDENGNYYDSYLSVIFEDHLNDSLEIIVEKLSPKGNSIGILIGDLNYKTFALEDTLHIKSDSGNRLKIHKDLISNDTIEGLVFEIDIDRDKFLADYYFIFNRKNKNNLAKKIIDFNEFKDN